MEEFKIDLDYTRDDLTAYWYGFVWKRAGKPLSLSDDPPQWARKLGRFFCWFFIVMGAVSIVNSLVQGQRMRTEEAGLLWNLMLSTPLGGVLEIAFGAGRPHPIPAGWSGPGRSTGRAGGFTAAALRRRVYGFTTAEATTAMTTNLRKRCGRTRTVFIWCCPIVPGPIF